MTPRSKSPSTNRACSSQSACSRVGLAGFHRGPGRRIRAKVLVLIPVLMGIYFALSPFSFVFLVGKLPLLPSLLHLRHLPIKLRDLFGCESQLLRNRCAAETATC